MLLAKKTNQNHTKNIKKEEKQKNSFTSKLKSREILEVIPITLVVAILPFIIRLNFIDLQGPFYDYWTGATQFGEAFSYYKTIFLYIISVVIILQLFFFTPRFKKTKAYYILGLLTITTILSTIFSEYREIALYGFLERHEGMWVWLSYILLTFASINLVNTEKQLKILTYSLAISGGIISLIAIFQYFDYDLISTQFVQNLMIPNSLKESITEVTFKFGKNYSYGVFANPNYLGGYMGFFAPLMLASAVLSKEIKERIFFGIIFILSSIALLFSKSEAGVLGYLVSILFMSVIFAIKYIKNKKEGNISENNILMILPIIFILVFPMISLSSETVRNSVVRIYNEGIEMLFTKNEPIDYRAAGPLNKIENISENEIKVVINNNTLIIKSENDNIILLDGEYNIITTHDRKTDQDIGLHDLGYLETNIYYRYFESHDKTGIRLFNWGSGITLYFLLGENEIITSDYKYQEIEIKDASYVGFEGKGSIGSNRGYIWSRSIPLLRESILIGSGPDTFITRFPRADLYAKQLQFGSPWSLWTVIDKPHNIYLQIGIHQGIVSLLGITFGLIFLLIKSTLLYIKKGLYKGFPFVIAIFSFMISSFFNDSIVGITPLIMIIIGISIGRLADFEIKDKGGKLDAK